MAEVISGLAIIVYTSKLYRVSHELGKIFQDLIPEIILIHKCHIHIGTIRNGYCVGSS